MEIVLRSFYETPQTHGGFSARLLRFCYSLLGGELAALERRHYGPIAMILDKVVEEKQLESSQHLEDVAPQG